MCAKGLALTVLCALGPLSARAVPPPSVQFTTDCDEPVYASDQLVCADPELRELNRLLAEWIGAGIVAAVTADTAESDAEWFSRSRMCAFEADHRGCLRAAYCPRPVWLGGSSAQIPATCLVTPAD